MKLHVQKHNKAGVIVISEKEYEKLKDPRKRFNSKADWNKLFSITDKVRERMSINDQRQLGSTIAKEVKAVRLKKQQHDK